MYNLIIGFSEEDTDFKSLIEYKFGSDLNFKRERGMDGVEFIFTVVIPLTEISIMIIQFILDNFQQCDKKSKRVLIEPGGKIDLTGYSADEAIKIIKNYFNSQEKHCKWNMMTYLKI